MRLIEKKDAPEAGFNLRDGVRTRRIAAAVQSGGGGKRRVEGAVAFWSAFSGCSSAYDRHHCLSRGRRLQLARVNAYD
jgi:hypothetical protein